MRKKYRNTEAEVTYGYFKHNGKKYRYEKEGLRCFIGAILIVTFILGSFIAWQVIKPRVPDTPVGYEKVYATEHVSDRDDIIDIAESYIHDNETMANTYRLKDLLLDIEVTNHESLDDMNGYIYIPVLIESEY